MKIFLQKQPKQYENVVFAKYTTTRQDIFEITVDGTTEVKEECQQP